MDFKKITDKITNFGNDNASYWGCALAGEVGEACNLIKKYDRGDYNDDKYPAVEEFQVRDFKKKLGHELADVFNYLELTARFFNIDLEEAIIEKIDIVLKKQENMVKK